MYKRILVLDGDGYIGSHTVYKLVEGGYDVVVADNMQTGHVEAIHPEARFYESDIRDSSFLDDIFAREKIDVVIHFAANSLVSESMRAPLDNEIPAVIKTRRPSDATELVTYNE